MIGHVLRKQDMRAHLHPKRSFIGSRKAHGKAHTSIHRHEMLSYVSPDVALLQTLQITSVSH